MDHHLKHKSDKDGWYWSIKGIEKVVVIVIDGYMLPPSTTWEHEEIGVEFPEAPTDTLLMQSYINHVTCRLWENEDQEDRLYELYGTSDTVV